MEKIDKYEIAKNQLLGARKPFDTALEALQIMSNNRDYVIGQMIELLRYINPSAEQFQTVRDLLKESKMPQLWCVRDENLNLISDIRLENDLNKPNSFLEYLNDITKEIPPQ